MIDMWTQWRKNNFKWYERYFPKGKDVLDLGAGDSHFYELFSQSKTYTGVDWKPYPRVNVIADLSKPISLQDASYDVVILSNTLEHLFNPQLVINESFRVLRKGGIILGTVPFIRNVHQAPADFYRYTFYCLEKLLKEAGFTRIEIDPIGTTYDVYELAHHLYFSYALSSHYSLKIRLLRKLTTLLNLFLPKDLQEKDFCEGYGFRAYKT